MSGGATGSNEAFSCPAVLQVIDQYLRPGPHGSGRGQERRKVDHE